MKSNVVSTTNTPLRSYHPYSDKMLGAQIVREDNHKRIAQESREFHIKKIKRELMKLKGKVHYG